MKEYYEILGLEEGATKEEVEKAYKKLYDKYSSEIYAEGEKGPRYHAPQDERGQGGRSRGADPQCICLLPDKWAGGERHPAEVAGVSAAFLLLPFVKPDDETAWEEACETCEMPIANAMAVC